LEGNDMQEDDNGLILELGNFHLPYKRANFSDNKLFVSFIKKCEHIVRCSPEYKDWVSYVKDTLGHKVCVFTEETSDELTIEIHHHPFTLFDITSIVLTTLMTQGQEFTSLDVSDKVLQLHYSDCIGYVPIVTSLHEKYHNGFLTIPPKFINGTWDYMLLNDSYFLDDEMRDKVNKLMHPSNNQYDQYFRWQKAA